MKLDWIGNLDTIQLERIKGWFSRLLEKYRRNSEKREIKVG